LRPITIAKGRRGRYKKEDEPKKSITEVSVASSKRILIERASVKYAKIEATVQETNIENDRLKTSIDIINQ
jgi:hypothetical protein